MQNQANTLEEIFGAPVSVYTRAQAIADGVLWEASNPENDRDVVSVCAQHFPNQSVATTSAVFEIIEKAVNNPRYGQDFAGILHDIFSMQRMYKGNAENKLFKVIINGAARNKYFVLRIVRHLDDNGAPAVTIMLPGEE